MWSHREHPLVLHLGTAPSAAPAGQCRALTVGGGRRAGNSGCPVGLPVSAPRLPGACRPGARVSSRRPRRRRGARERGRWGEGEKRRREREGEGVLSRCQAGRGARVVSVRDCAGAVADVCAVTACAVTARRQTAVAPYTRTAPPRSGRTRRLGRRRPHAQACGAVGSMGGDAGGPGGIY